jgi:hypothetical protein
MAEMNNSTSAINAPTLSLSPRKYHALNEIAKRHGAVLMPSDFAEMGGAWGSFNHLAGGVFKDMRKPAGPGSCDECHIIKIATTVDPQEVANTRRPEMDWGAIPHAKLFDFILWHELGHKLCNYRPWERVLIESPTLLHEAAFINEVLADRFAWLSIFPGSPVPVALHADPAAIERIFENMESLGLTLASKQPPRALPMGKGEYVPVKLASDPRFSKFLH